MKTSNGLWPWTEEIRALRATRGQDGTDRLLLDGLRLAEAASAAGLRFECLGYAPAFCHERSRAEALVARLEADGVPLAHLTKAEFSRLSYKADGLVAIVRYAPPSLAQVLPARAGVTLVLDGLSDPGNVGAVIRTANAWEASGVVAVDGAARLRHPKCLRASLGAIFHTPCAAASRAEVVARLAGCDVAVLDPRAPPLTAGALTAEGLVVVLGNERRGVHLDLRRLATHRLGLPMGGHVDSLNVSNAAAVVLWEAYRRRRHV